MSRVWVLVDERVGSSNQAVSLANILGHEYSIKKLEYNFLAKLPNFFNIGFSILKNRKEILQDQIQMPELVISAGRRAASIAISLKKINPHLKLIHIMKPEIDIKKFDIVILPEHDRQKEYNKYSNIIYINGAITHIPKQKLDIAGHTWGKLIDDEMYPTPRIGVLIGGEAKGCKFYIGHAKILVDKLLKAAKELDASLLVTTSRRTPSAVTNLLKKLFKETRDARVYFYDSKSGKDNPYFGILALSDYIVTTADSINMCCEAVETGVPVFIFQEENMVSKKHQRFADGLIVNKLAMRLENKVFNFKHKSMSNSHVLKAALKNII